MTTPLDSLRAEIAALKAQGHTAVSVDSLEKYLARQPQTDSHAPAPIRFEEWRHKTGLQHEHQMQTIKATLDSGLAALRATILINGGAAVAVLAFLGNVVGKETNAIRVSVPGIRWALELFVAGVFCSAVALGWRYLSDFSNSMLLVRQSQLAAANDEAPRETARRSLRRWLRFGFAAIVGALLFGIGSLGGFIWGGIKAAHSVW